EALEIQPFTIKNIWDGELDGRMVKIMPVNRIATKADLESLKSNLPYQTYEKRSEENPDQPVEKITLVCMGHEPDLKASLEAELSKYKLDIEVVRSEERRVGKERKFRYMLRQNHIDIE